MKRYTILDLDNCISNDGWRIPKINWNLKDPFRRYHEYHMLGAFDELSASNWNQIHARAKAFDSDNFLVFTSRPLHYRCNTEQWLTAHGIRYEHLLMRNDNDHRSSTEVKAAMLHWLSEYGIMWEQITYAVDDRADILDVYRKAGIFYTEQFEIHDVCAYTPRGQQLELTV